MSTYLACFIVCDFEKLDTAYSQRGTHISVYARPGQSSSMLYTRDLTVAAMDYYTDYFKIDYPLPKLGNFYVVSIFVLPSIRSIVGPSPKGPGHV